MSSEVVGMSSDKDIALIQKDVEYIKGDIKEIKQAVKDLSGVYVTTIQFNDELRTVKTQLAALAKANGLWKWLSPTLSAIVTAVVTLLVVSYISHLPR